MQATKRDRLFAHIPPQGAGRLGISAEDIGRVEVVPGLVDTLIECLQSDDNTDVTFGLYFAEHLRHRADFCSGAGPSLAIIASLIRASLSNSSAQTRAAAVRAFASFRESYDDYGSVMRELLHSPDSMIRQAALAAAPTFLSAKELDILLPFRSDDEVGETGGMGGPWRYNLRDFALEIAERIAGQKFDNGDCVERIENREISWRSWSSFTKWLERRRKRKLF